MGLLKQKLIVVVMHDNAIIAALFEDQHRAFPVVHKTGAAIDPMAEIVQQMIQAAGKTPLDVRDRDVVPAMGDPLGWQHRTWHKKTKEPLSMGEPPDMSAIRSVCASENGWKRFLAG